MRNLEGNELKRIRKLMPEMPYATYKCPACNVICKEIRGVKNGVCRKCLIDQIKERKRRERFTRSHEYRLRRLALQGFRPTQEDLNRV